MRCANQHHVPQGFSHCRRCELGSGAAVAVAVAAPVTVGDYLAKRDRVLALDVAVVVACAVVVTGSSPAAVLPGLMIGALALVAVRLLAMACRDDQPASRPASALHVRLLDRLAMAPAVLVGLTALVAVARW